MMRPITLLMAVAMLMSKDTTAQVDSCQEYFETPLVEFFNYVVLEVRDVSELSDVGTLLGTVKWKEDMLDDPVRESNSDTADGDKYLTGTSSQNTIDFTVTESMEGVPDYPESVVKLQITYSFDVTNPDPIDKCLLQFIVYLKDENNQIPVVEPSASSVEIREDFPAQLTIPGLEVMASDNDYGDPNNVLSVELNSPCPLEAEKTSYAAAEGKQVEVSFHLTSQLDWDTMEEPYTIDCQGKITDGGSPQLSSDFSILITVLPFNDEPPQFEHPLYSIQLDDLQVPSEALTVTPEAIRATDGDTGDTIQYSMVADSGSTEYNSYFTIDSSTAQVSQTQDLPEDVLDEVSLFFIVTATDDGSREDTSVLQIVPPDIEKSTTTSSTETTSTTTTTTPTTDTSEPCTPCPTTSFWTTMTPPSTSTTTIPSTTTPSTTTEDLSTCPPCTTESITCPTPGTTDHTDTPTDPTTTTSTTINTEPSTTTTILPTTETCPTCETCEPCSSTPFFTDTTTTSMTSSTSTTSTTTPPDTTPPAPTTTQCPTFEPCECSTVVSDGTTTTTSSNTGSPTSTTTTDPSSTTTTDPSSTTTTDPSSTTTSGSGSTTTTTEGPITTPEPSGPNFKFRYSSYHFMPYTSTLDVGVLEVIEEGGGANPQTLKYEWEDDSEGTDFILLDSDTGEVTLDTDLSQVGEFELTAVAYADEQTLSAPVFVVIQPERNSGSVTIPFGIRTLEVDEPGQTGSVLTTINAEGEVQGYCIVGADPPKYLESFSINDDGELKQDHDLDSDDTELGSDRIVTLRVLAKDTSSQSCAADPNSELQKSEALVAVKIVDMNDEDPEITSPDDDLTIGYPTNEGLRQVVGSLLTVKVYDPDTVGETSIGVGGDDAKLFTVEQTDKDTGEVFLLDPSGCMDGCTVQITVTDEENDGEPKELKVISLGTEDLFTIVYKDMTVPEIEDMLDQTSNGDITLYLLYVTVQEEVFAIPSRNTAHGAYDRAADSWITTAHVYGVKEDGTAITLQELNSLLTDSTYTASPFTEKEVFEPPSTDLTGYQVAVGVLSGLLVVIIVGGVLGYVYYRKNGRMPWAKKTAGHNKQSPTQGISTIGAAYPNHAYETEMTHKDRSNSTSTDGGLSRPPTQVTSFNDPIGGGMSNHTPPSVGVTSELPRQTSSYQATQDQPMRKTSVHSTAGLLRIDPGPAPEGLKSSPYLTGAEGAYSAVHHNDTDGLKSHTAYKGGQDQGPKSKPSSMYPSLQDSSTPYDVERDDEFTASSSSTYNRGASTKSADQPVSQYAIPVKQRKEPINTSTAQPAKPIMKNKKETSSSSTQDVVKPPTSSSSSGGTSTAGASSTKSSPKMKKSEPKQVPSEPDTTDTEGKKSVSFKVLVDEKEIESTEDDEDKNTSL